MLSPIALHTEFARVIACDRCSTVTDRRLLRDDCENVPQPGYVGRNYPAARVLLVGQNPGTPKTLADQDRPYTAALRALRDDPVPERYSELSSILQGFIPKWPVHGNYFPLAECGLSLDDIAYCNVVRCRTSGDAAPGQATVNRCVATHFTGWVEFLAPRVVVFVGKWAHERASGIVEGLGIPCAFMNRQRSLSSAARVENRNEVVQLVQSAMANPSVKGTSCGKPQAAPYVER